MKPTVPETGKIIKVEGGSALVMIEGGTGCKGCGAAKIGLCRAGGKTMFLTVRNTVLAGPGDRVIIGIDKKTQRIGYLLAYLVPLGAFMTGALAGHLLGERLSMPSLDFLAAFVSLAASLAFTLVRLRRLDRSYSMEVKRTVTDGEFNECVASEEERLYLKYTA